MLSYILRRLLISIPILLGITVIVFTLASLMPGDAVLAMVTDEAPNSAEMIAMRRGQLGLDQPIYIQYFSWIGNLFEGNLGVSFISGRPVMEVIGERLGITLQLMGLALAISIVLGTALGIISALKKYTKTDYGLTLGGMIGVSIPDFFMGLILVYLFSVQLRWFPSSGVGTAGNDYDLIDNLRHLALPATALALFRAAIFMRYARSSMLEVINQDYIKTARAKGLKSRRIIMVHALRNAIIPTVTILGLTMPILLGGSIVIETIFQWPGIGLLFFDAVVDRDSPVIMGYVLVIAAIVMISNLLTDIAYGWLDPRVQYD